MITCNRCGNMNHTGTVNCQTCGAPLSSKIEGGMSSRMEAQEQQEGLPAWLESLRVGERSAVPASNPSRFSAADLIEDGALPSWMRPGRPDGEEAVPTNPSSPLRSASFPGSNTDDRNLPPQGLAANSLIDEQALPSWMHENKQSATQAPQTDISAASLIQPEFVPDWLKTMQPQQSPTFKSTQSSNSSLNSGEPQGANFSARDLIDPQSLPSWMGQNTAAPASPEAAGASHNLSPSSLIDMDALPSWMRENGQNAQERNSGGFPSAIPAQSNQPWQAPGVSGQGFPANGRPIEGERLAAASFVDPNSLPEWLRPAANQQQMGGSLPPNPVSAGGSRAGSYSVPPRVENVRVPSRPRSELNPNENSEVAANVFASMLGVASAAPHFPGAPAASAPYGQGSPMQQGMPYEQGSPMQQGMPYGQGSPMQQGMPYEQGSPMQQGMSYGQMSPVLQGMPPVGHSMPEPGIGSMQGQAAGYGPGGYQGGNSMNYQGGYQGNGPVDYQGGYPMGRPPTDAPYQPGGMAGSPPMQGPMGMTPEQRTGTKPAKRGFFEAIRDLFFRQS